MSRSEVSGNGLLIDMIQVLSDRLNFTYTLVDGRSESGVVDLVARRAAAMSVNLIVATPQHLSKVDISATVAHQGYKIMYR